MLFSGHFAEVRMRRIHCCVILLQDGGRSEVTNSPTSTQIPMKTAGLQRGNSTDSYSACIKMVSEVEKLWSQGMLNESERYRV